MKKLQAGFLVLCTFFVVSCGNNCPSGQTSVNGVCQYAGGYPGYGYGSYPYGTPYYPSSGYYPAGTYYAPQGYGYPTSPYYYGGGTIYPCPMGAPACYRAN